MKLMSFNFQGLVVPHKISTLKTMVGLEHPNILLLQETIKGGLVIGWNERTIKALNLWGMESVLWGSIFFHIYGPYLNRIPFWDSLFNNTQQSIKLRLASILSSIKEVLNSFVSFSCQYVYRDNNKEEDKASKEGLQMAMGI